MAWAYCEHCGAGLNRPSIRETICEEEVLYEMCGKTSSYDQKEELVRLLEDFQERISKWEEK